MTHICQLECESCSREAWLRQENSTKRQAYLAKWDDPLYEFVEGSECLHAKGSSCYSLDRLLEFLAEAGYTRELLTREQAVTRMSRPNRNQGRLRRCRVCCPDVPEAPAPKRLITIKLTGLGWPIGDGSGRCARSARDMPRGVTS